MMARDADDEIVHPIALEFAEGEGSTQPIDGLRGVLVRDHRHDRRHVLPLILGHFVSSPPREVDVNTYLLSRDLRPAVRSSRTGLSGSLDNSRNPAYAFTHLRAGRRARQT